MAFENMKLIKSKNDESQTTKKPRGCINAVVRKMLMLAAAALALAYMLGLLLNLGKGTMNGTNVASQTFAVNQDDAELIFDLTGVDDNGKRIYEHQIFDRLLKMIDEAEDLIVLDMFLVNRFKGGLGGDFHRDTSGELARALVECKREKPELLLLFITDPINAGYEYECPDVLKPLAEAGGFVVLTNLRQLADSNMLYSPFYRALRYLKPVAPFAKTRIFANPFDADSPKFNLIQVSRMLNFKANHRKVAVIRDQNREWQALVTSANPHSGSSAHGNVALFVRGRPAKTVLKSELDIARATLLRTPQMAFGPTPALELVRQLEKLDKQIADASQYKTNAETDGKEKEEEPAPGKTMLQYCTEKAVLDKILWLLNDTRKGERIDLAMFYLSDSKVIEALKEACARGAKARILLDPNKDAFGRNKNGIPNRAVAADLVEWAAGKQADIQIRWFDTHGEQAHFKLLHVRDESARRGRMIIGSANFTPRNLRGRNLESAFYIEDNDGLSRQCSFVFDRLWENKLANFSVPYDEYASTGLKLKLQKLLTAFGNATGFCTW